MRNSKLQKEKGNEQLEQQLSTALMNPLKQLVTYDSNTFVNLTLNHLKTPLEIQVRKINDTKELRGQKLLLVVLNNHIKAIVDLKDFPQLNGNHNSNQSSRRSFNEKTSVAMYEQLGNQFFDSDQQLNKLIIISNDFFKAQSVIQQAIKNYTSKNYRFRTNKIIQSRVRLLEIILSVLRTSGGKQNGEKEIPPVLQLRHQGTSFKELENSHVRLIVQELDQKVYQLSTISEQIPQLETFKRTLDLTMPEHNVYLTKIVDVLIELHHKVNKLISRRPQKLLKEIEAVEQQCLIIQKATEQFITLIDSQGNVRIKPIYFDQRKNNSPEHFRKVQKNVVKLSEKIISFIGLQQQAKEQIQQIKAMIEVFWNLLAGVEEYQREWRQYRNRQDRTDDEEEILKLLDLCLKFVNEKIDKMSEEFELEKQALIDASSKKNQLLQEDFHKIRRQNHQQRAVIKDLQIQISRLRNDAKEWQMKYRDLLRKADSDKLQSQRYKTRVVSDLELELKKKQSIIMDLKRVISELEDKQSAVLSQEQNYLNLKKFADELEDRLRDKDLELKNREQDYNNIVREIREKDNKIKDLDLVISANKSKLNELESRLKMGGQDKNKIIRDLQGKLAGYEENGRKLRQLQLKLANAQRDARRVSQVENKFASLQQELKAAQDISRQSNRTKDSNERRIRELQLELNTLRTKSNQNINNEQALKDAKLKLQKLNDLERELRISKDENARLKKFETDFYTQTNKIANLQVNINDRNRKISQLQSRIRSLEYQLSNSSNQLAKLRSLVDELRVKERELITLKQKPYEYEPNRVNDTKVSQYLKQIEFLKQKIRSLEDLIDIFNQEHAEIQRRLKSYQSREEAWKVSDQRYQKLLRDYSTLTTQFKSRDQEIATLKYRMDQQKATYMASTKSSFNETAAKQRITLLERQIGQLRELTTKQKYDQSSIRQKIIILERQISQLKDQLAREKTKFTSSEAEWLNQERIYKEQINRLLMELQKYRLEQREGFKDDGRYYLRVKGQRLEELIGKMENGMNKLLTHANIPI